MNEFHFHTKVDQTLLLGQRARNIPELLELITIVPESSIYYHTHRFLQQHHYLSPEPPNDFAYWITDVLNDAPLGEKLSSVDIVQFHNLADLRRTFVEILEKHLQGIEKVVHCPAGQEFHFMACKTFVLKTPLRVQNLAEFRDAVNRVTITSIYYHVFDAKLRLEKGENDFSRWFRDLGRVELANEVAQMDPYTYTLEGLRKRIIVLVRKHDKD